MMREHARKTEPHATRAAGRGAALGRLAVVGTVLLVGLLWSYWAVVVGLWREWQRDPNYSVGQLVPLAALYVLWHARDEIRAATVSTCWWGLVVLVGAQVLRLGGLLFLYESAERYALVLTIGGLVLLTTGKHVFWRVRWVLAFLLLMVPLPGRVHNAISGPLQDWATAATVAVLDLCGVYVSREGNILTLSGNVPVGIAEACSGLRMLTAFVVVAAVLALLAQRPAWQRVTLLVSSVPIAIVCNVVRVCATIALYLHVGRGAAELFIHDFAGVSMMPLAIGLLLGELWLLNQLVVADVGGTSARRSVPVRAELSDTA